MLSEERAGTTFEDLTLMSPAVGACIGWEEGEIQTRREQMVGKQDITTETSRFAKGTAGV